MKHIDRFLGAGLIMAKMVYTFFIGIILQAGLLPLLADRLPREPLDYVCTCCASGDPDEAGVATPLGGAPEIDIEDEPEASTEVLESVYRMVLDRAEQAIERDLYELVNPGMDPALIEDFEHAATGLGVHFRQLWENANYGTIIAAVRLYGGAMVENIPSRELTPQQIIDALPEISVMIHELNSDSALGQYEPRERLIRSLIYRFALTYIYANTYEGLEMATVSRTQSRRLLVRALYAFQLNLEDRFSLWVRHHALMYAWDQIQEVLHSMQGDSLQEIPWIAFALRALGMNAFTFSMHRMLIDYPQFEFQGQSFIGQLFFRERIFMHPNLPALSEDEMRAHDAIYRRVLERSFLQFSAIEDEMEGGGGHLERAIIHLVLARLRELQGNPAEQELYSHRSLEHFVESLRDAPREAVQVVTTFAPMHNGTHPSLM